MLISARTIVNDHLDEAADRTKEKIQWLVDLEGNPTTLNTHYYSDYKDKFLAHYKAALDDSDLATKLRVPRRSSDFELSINKVLSKLNDIGISTKATAPKAASSRSKGGSAGHYGERTGVE